MLTTLLMCVALQLPMGKIIVDAEKPAPIQTVILPKEFFSTEPIKPAKPIIKTIYVVIDKFGNEHSGEDKAKLLKEVREANKEPFKLKDVAGQVWSHQDDIYLRKWVEERNRTLQYSGQSQ